MALQVNIKTQYGINCNYWIISKIEKDKISQTSYVILYGFPSKKERVSGNTSIEKRYINVYPKDYDDVFGTEVLNEEGMNDTKSLYKFIKKNFEEFKNAEFAD